MVSLKTVRLCIFSLYLEALIVGRELSSSKCIQILPVAFSVKQSNATLILV